MNPGLRHTVSLFIDNYHSLRKTMFWKADPLRAKLCALCHAFEGNSTVPGKLIEYIAHIKKFSKWYSPLRHSSYLAASLLSASGTDPGYSFPRFMACYLVMKRSGFICTVGLPAAALALYATSGKGSEKARAERSLEVHGGIRRRHPFTTSPDEYATSVIMAASGRSAQDILADCGETLRLLRIKGFYSTSALRFLSRLLAYDPSPPWEKAARCANISDMLKRMKIRTPRLFYGTAGLLFLTGDHWNNAMREVLDTVGILRLGKCFLPFEKEQALIFSSALVVGSFFSDGRDGFFSNLRICEGISMRGVIESHIITCCASPEAPDSFVAVS
jgi:hypothetical protein